MDREERSEKRCEGGGAASQTASSVVLSHGPKVMSQMTRTKPIVGLVFSLQSKKQQPGLFQARAAQLIMT